MVNDHGGINGRRLDFISCDDGYSPAKTIEMTRKLVEEDKVLFIFNSLGTAPNTAIQKYLKQRRIPQLFVATGASKWGKPTEFPWTMGWSPTYAAEAAIFAQHIVRSVKDPKIAILKQNDHYGHDYLGGFKEGLGKESEHLIVQLATYEPIDPSVDSSAPKFAAQAIRKAREIDWRPAHYLNTISSNVGAIMQPAGYENGQGVITALYRKDATDARWDNAPDVIAFKVFMREYMPLSDIKNDGHTYGYAVAHTMIEVLRRCGDNLTRANIMRVAANLHELEIPLLLPGIRVDTRPTNFYPIRSMQLARFRGQSWELFGDVLAQQAVP
jgi:branched-chain amino acid transport system substrate-binding protein